MICNETITVEELSFIRHMMERHRYCTSCSTCWKNQYEYLPPPPRLEKIVDYSEFAEIKPKTMIFRPTKLDIYPPNESLKRKFYDEESERSPYGKLFKRTFEASVKDAEAKIKQNDIPPVLKYIKQENQPYVVDNERHEHEVGKMIMLFLDFRFFFEEKMRVVYVSAVPSNNIVFAQNNLLLTLIRKHGHFIKTCLTQAYAHDLSY